MVKNRNITLTGLIKNASSFVSLNPRNTRSDWEDSLLLSDYSAAFPFEKKFAWKVASSDYREKLAG